ncbi:hypothetical protein COO91_06548 [Nostoc flagelliforme CCNUN1]|uniref:Uncharacterized protein n=1 Tax=Nostoc flagelliforme CCNUN1 TaxID=2038116 RepID=A0A2K8SYK9_9NOSO|nr:hypothetical protein COO91_06548 [Nostoc flagelliforme CCNUN1]
MDGAFADSRPCFGSPLGSGGCFFDEIIAIIQLSTFKGLGSGEWGVGEAGGAGGERRTNAQCP